MPNLPILSFNSGELSPLIDARSDIEKYRSGCRVLENFLPRIYGCIERRPGFEFIYEAKNSPQGVRLIPFIYNSEIAYMCEFGDLYIRFYYDKAILKDSSDIIVETATPYLVADLMELQYAQIADVMWLAHEDYAPRKLSRTTTTHFDLSKITFTGGPFRTRNDLDTATDYSAMTMTSSVYAAAATGTLTASAAFFNTGHIGALMKLTHKKTTTMVELTANGTSSAITLKGDFRIRSHGTWTATVTIQRSEDGGTTWDEFVKYKGVNDTNIQESHTESMDDIQYRIVIAGLAGTIGVEILSLEGTVEGIVRIDTITSTTVANITVIEALDPTEYTNATTRWAEGCWSAYRGYPNAITFFQQRAIYGGSSEGMATIWLSTIGDFDDFEEGETDDASFAIAIPTTNKICWLASTDKGIVVGTSGDEWLIKSNRIGTPITISNYTIDKMSSVGSCAMQPIEVGNVILFNDSVRRKIREFVYASDTDKFETPDVTALAEHITETGIISQAIQKNPDQIIWNVLNNGYLISFNYDRDQNVIAAAKHLTNPTMVDSTEVADEISEPVHYPLLRELTAAEIPDKPAEPADTALVAATSVTDKAGLQAIAGAGHYSIDADIDCTGAWTPIANFSGVIEGNGYTISNLTISAAASDSQAMFSSLVTGADIRDLIFNTCTVTGKDNVAILAAVIDTQASIILKDIDFVDCSVTGEWNVGCLIGYSTASSLNVFRCTTTACIVAGHTETGSLIGYFDQSAGTSSSVVDCFASGGTVTTTHDSQNPTGGLVGEADGLAAARITFHSCYATCPVSSNDQKNGGFVGYTTASDYISCYATGSVTCTTDGYSGGFVGEAWVNCDITNCYATGAVTGVENWLGGFAGWINGGTVLRCYSTGKVTQTTTDNTGGTGGFAGMISGTAQEVATISRCFSWGDVQLTQGTDTAGGFVGKTYKTTNSPVIQNCYAWGSVLSDDGNTAYFGGFCGNASDGTTFTNCYDAQTNTEYGSGLTNQITEDTGVEAGFVAKVGTGVVVTTSYWDTETSGLVSDISTGAVGHLTDWMMTKSNYEDAGWDMTTIWELDAATIYVQMEAAGTVKSVAVIPAEDEDEVWISCLLDISGVSRNYIECMKPRVWDTREDCFYVDSGITYDGIATNVITGLDHLEGEEVVILGDGAVFTPQTVSGGQITLPDGATISKAQVGLAYTYKVKPMRFDITGGEGTTKGSIKQIPEVVISFLDTLDAQVGADESRMFDLDWRTTEDYDSPPDLYTGDMIVSPDGGFSVEDPLYISGSEPLPCTVRAIIPRLEKTGR